MSISNGSTHVYARMAEKCTHTPRLTDLFYSIRIMRYPVPFGIYRPPPCVHPSIYLIRLYVSCAFVIDRPSVTEIESCSDDSRWWSTPQTLRKVHFGFRPDLQSRVRPLDHLRRSERDKGDYIEMCIIEWWERKRTDEQMEPEWYKSIIQKIGFK